MNTTVSPFDAYHGPVSDAGTPTGGTYAGHGFRIDWDPSGATVATIIEVCRQRLEWIQSLEIEDEIDFSDAIDALQSALDSLEAHEPQPEEPQVPFEETDEGIAQAAAEAEARAKAAEEGEDAGVPDDSTTTDEPAGEGEDNGWMDFTVEELKDEIRTRNSMKPDDEHISLTGTKQELADRLTEDDAAQVEEPAT